MTFLKSRTGSTRVVGCPSVSATAPDGYILPMFVDPNTTPAGGIWLAIPRRFHVAGNAIASISGSVVVATLTVPDQGVAGTVLTMASCLLQAGTNGDLFDVKIDNTVSDLGINRIPIVSAVGPATVLGIGVAMPAGAAMTFRILVSRSNGSGTAGTTSDFRYHQLHAVFFPN